MTQRLTSRFIFKIIIINLFFVTTVLSQNKQKIEVTIEGLSSSDKLIHFNKGEEFRKQFKFKEAIEEYKQVIFSSGEICGKEAESHYNIGICNTWLFELEKAENVFHEVIENYPDDGQASGNSEFCLAWIDVQKGNYNSAIERLQNTLEKDLEDMELCARIQFEIGRVYSLYLCDYDRAREAFLTVLTFYPNSNMAKHPWLINLKAKK